MPGKSSCRASHSASANALRSERCPQRCSSCDSTGRYVPQSLRARNPEGAEVAAVPDPPGTVVAVSEALAEARPAALAVFPAPEAAGLSWQAPAEDCFGARHTIRECRGHGPCSNARPDRHHLRVCCGLSRVHCPAPMRNSQSTEESLALERISSLSISFFTPIWISMRSQSCEEKAGRRHATSGPT